jgi:UV DNA damage endonuclease
MIKLGYACINLSLGKNCKVNRGMIKRTFLSKGLSYVSELILKNLTDLEKIIDWNIEHQIEAYRMSSDMFPWFSEYKLSDLPQFDLIQDHMNQIGQKILTHNLRVSFHPGPFNCLASPRPEVVQKTISELNKHSQLMDLFGFEANHNTKINIHVGGAYGDKIKTAQRFNQNFKLLSKSTQQRLTVENDDKESLFSISDLYELIYSEIHIPLVFDYHHHNIKSDGINEQEALEMAIESWNSDIIPTTHFSSARKIYESSTKNEKIQSHADYIYQPIQNYGQKLYIILESKAKDLALLKYRQDFLTN